MGILKPKIENPRGNALRRLKLDLGKLHNYIQTVPEYKEIKI
jgi:hypothetical protein